MADYMVSSGLARFQFGENRTCNLGFVKLSSLSGYSNIP